MFYDRFMLLCRIHSLEVTPAGEMAGLSNAATAYWKKHKGSRERFPNKTLAKLSNFFMVDPAFLIGEVDDYHSDRAHEIATDQYPEHLKEIILENMKKLSETHKLDDAHMEQIQSCITDSKLPTIQDMEALCEIAGVDISYLFGPYSYCVKSSINTNVRVALFGGDVEVTDAMWEEAKAYAALIVARQKAEKKGK